MQRVESENAPAALGAYSQAIVANGFVFCSGQLGLDPKTMEFVTEEGESGKVKAETRQAIKNLQSVLEKAGSSLAKIVKVTILLDNINDFSAVDSVYREYFLAPENDPPPARACFAVDKLPKGGLVEIECVAIL